jgi:CBS domain-containing protein
MPHAMPKTVAEAMTRKVVTIGENDTLETAEQGMKRFHFRHLPVVEGGKLVGIVSHRDLLHAASSFLSEAEEARNKLIHKQPAKAVMHTDLVTVGPEDSLYDAAKLMWEGKLGCLPVLDGDKLVGILTEADFVRLAMRALGGSEMPPPPSSYSR